MIDVAMTRAEARACDVAVVIDVLRATSTIAEALAAGYERVLCAETLERGAGLRAPGRVLAGERRCLRPEGFDQGNSPLEARRVLGAELVLATTNGAPTIIKAATRAPQVVLAALLNLEAVARMLRAAGRPAGLDVQIVCSGADGAVALEDVYVAGRLSALLPGPRSDAARLVEAVARGFRTAHDALHAGLGAQRLRAVGLSSDIAHCARESRVDLVPVVSRVGGCSKALGRGVAVVTRADATAPWDASELPVDRADTVKT